MALPHFTMRELLEAGAHFGHRTRRWNPKMAPYIYGERNGLHIIDLQQTMPLLHQSLVVLRDIAARNGRILFVGTKRQAAPIVAEQARRCGQYYVNHRWLGGMLTNWKTVSQSIRQLQLLEERIADESLNLTKKEKLQMTRQRNKLDAVLGGIRDMAGLPDAVVVLDTSRESIAVTESVKLGLPVVAIADTNSDPDHITHLVPGNDDATRAIGVYCRLFADAVLDGIQQQLSSSGVDIGAMEEAPKEAAPAVEEDMPGDAESGDPAVKQEASAA